MKNTTVFASLRISLRMRNGVLKEEVSESQKTPSEVCFPISWFYSSGGQTTGVFASASVLPMKIQD